MNVEEIIRFGHLRDEFVARLVHEKTFVRRAEYDALVAEVDRLHQDQEAWEALTKGQKDGATEVITCFIVHFRAARQPPRSRSSIPTQIGCATSSYTSLESLKLYLRFIVKRFRQSC